MGLKWALEKSSAAQMWPHSGKSILLYSKKASQNVIYDMFSHCFIGSRIGGIGGN